MKKSSIILFVAASSVYLTILCSQALAAGKQFGVGLTAGGGALPAMYQTWRIGLAFGYRPAEHLVLAADLSFGALTLKNSSSSSIYSGNDSQSWTTVPFTLSLLYRAPLRDRAVAYLGAGIGYHFFQRTTSSHTVLYGQGREESHKSSFQALAPQAVVGLEFMLSDSLALQGEMKYFFGTASHRETLSDLTTSQDINFGGMLLTLGLFFIF